jgi:signal transduction histidine kinase
LSELVARERAFSADASHQLRTPLAGLRLELEAALDLPDSELRQSISAALVSADQLAETVADLLELARNVPARAGLGPVGSLLTRLELDWGGLFADQERMLCVTVPADIAGRLVVAPVLRQIVAVLVENALRHGRGVVTVAVRDLGAAIAVDVSDEGPGVDGVDPLAKPAGEVATRRGIGLPLARRLAEAESGRLWLAVPAPPTFTLVLPTHGETGHV